MGSMEPSQKDWLGGRQFDVDKYLHGATLEETVATGVYCLVTGKGRDSNVYFLQSGESWVLVDTGWRGRAELIRSAAETLFGVGAKPRAIVLTHVHPDHAGSAFELAQMWDVTVYVHPDEIPLPPSGRVIGALARVERRWMFPSGQDGLSPIDPNVGVPGLPEWQVIPTPGHTPGHLALFREGDRALITGDAVLTVNLNSLRNALSHKHTLGGPPRFVTWNWRSATESVAKLTRLEPSVLAPGHGRPMAGPVLAPALSALREQLNNPASAGSSAGHKRTEWFLNLFDYGRRAHPSKGLQMEGVIARWYTKVRSGEAQDAQRAREARQLTEGLSDGARVLEVAPGPGFLSIELARLGRFEVTGMDASHTFVDIATAAAAKAEVKVEFRQGDAADMPFPDDSFDRIVCQAAFKNFSRPVKALDEMHRVLRPGATAVIQDMNRRATGAAIKNEVAGMGLSVFDAPMTRFVLGQLRRRAYSPEEFEAMAKQSAFMYAVTTHGITVETRLTKPGP
jgi:glyoxylase-like metal-dependent hydrolase (beta-lactamase superfamily II)/ubiquinone/menaquinone biosynthesis C-methylase UbiE